MTKKLVLIDSHAIIHRAYHALPPLNAPSGEPTNAVYGFTTILLRILRELKPDFVAAAFDLPGPTFRHIAYERYKAQRPETPSDLSSQFGKVREVLAAFDIPVFEKAGYEADDIIGTIAKNFEKKKDVEIIIVTGDLDALQLVRPRIKVYAMKKGITETMIYDERAVKERYGLAPAQVIDFKGLKGDPSDNIPGVKGIGEKTAADLIKNFGSIEGVYKALKKKSPKISPAVAERLREGVAQAEFSKELATINTKVPIKLKLENLKWQEDRKNQEVTRLFQKLGFYSLLKRMRETEKPTGIQESLIGVEKSASTKKLVESVSSLREIFPKIKNNSLALILLGKEIFLIPQDSNASFLLGSKFFKEEEVKNFFSAGEFSCFDGKTLIHLLRSYETELGKITYDLGLASYVAGALGRDFSFPAIASRELGRLVSQDPRDEFMHFFDIAKSLDTKLFQGKLKKIYEEIELPLIRVLADMEERGIRVDKEFLKVLAKKVDKELQEITKEIYALSGEAFNINSSQQLSHILFDKLKIKTQGLRKTDKGGVISTRESELEKLKGAHPLIKKILSYRELMKLKTTYIDSLPGLIDEKTGRLHTTFNQTGTATGRLSSSNPNLQNIPILSEYGREVRKAFVADKGFLLASFDYSQIELRVAAHLARDQKMIEAFRRGLDIHKMTAAEIYNVPLDKVTPDLRRSAKTLNFGMLYGMGPQAFSEATGFSREDSKKFIDEYFQDFSGIRNYLERTKRFVEENGYVETLFGRRRYIPEIHSPNWQLKHEAERMAINAPIQGSAADLVKIAMIKVYEWIRKEKLEDDVRMLLQVHDELLFEIKKELMKKVAPKIKELIEGVAKLNVPLVVDIGVGQNWGEMERM